METNQTTNATAERYARDGSIRDILRASGVDYTGDRVDLATGEVVSDTPSDAAKRLAPTGCISPTALAQLRQIGIEV
ncbi:MAG TPA: hypothetical protein VFL85_03985 [Candidatus Saccharimonadales bacterium]|nr:hypothetical protein [Candidatus Saccharimonadales bacterium]